MDILFCKSMPAADIGIVIDCLGDSGWLLAQPPIPNNKISISVKCRGFTCCRLFVNMSALFLQWKLGQIQTGKKHDRFGNCKRKASISKQGDCVTRHQMCCFCNIDYQDKYCKKIIVLMPFRVKRFWIIAVCLPWIAMPVTLMCRLTVILVA
ncbi:hypothetical protein ACO0LM_28170 [Undibacterium sp. Di26W]|uniref:hypothetical protein n=1 Tax=Undibacterium sp. Di26W TaxID=3413035 RepID=UPI003BF392D6